MPGEGYFRLFPFVNGSHTSAVVNSPEQAFEAALQFGRFTNLLSGFDSNSLHITLPDLHNLRLRYSHFESAIINGNKERIKESAELINKLKKFNDIVTISEAINSNRSFKKKLHTMILK